MKAILLMAGKGSRMRPHTHTKAKPLLPIAGKPAIDYCLDSFSELDISEYIFITGHLKDQVENHVKENYPSINARFIEQTQLDGTAGAIRLTKAHVDEPVIILFTDTLFEADLSVIKNSTDDGILWAKEVEDYQRFGVMVCDENNHMTKIVEKPKEPISKLANIGLYYVKNYQLLFEGIEHLYEQNKVDKGEYWLTDAFQYMIEKGAKLKVEPVRGWFDSGQQNTTLESNALLLQKRHIVKSTPENCVINEPVFIDEGCTLRNSVIGPNVSISKNCTINDAEIVNSIIDEETTVERITLHDSILGQNTLLEGTREHKVRLMLGDHSKTRFGK